MPKPIRERMAYLEEIDRKDRLDGTTLLKRLRQVPPETGKFIALMLAASPLGAALEVGTSAGYSGMWLALACRATGKKLTTFEVLDEKAALARETFKAAGVEDVVTLVHGDARKLLCGYSGVSFAFLDCEKEYYLDCYNLLVPRMVEGGLLIVDNVTSHADELQEFLSAVHSDRRVDCAIVPYKSGELLCRINKT